MKSISEFIESGILELYALGAITAQEAFEVEKMAMVHAEVRVELKVISRTLEDYALVLGKTPSPKIKPVLLATLDFINRMQNGEDLANPPELTAHSKIEDYAEWLDRNDMVPPKSVTDVFVKVIGYNLRATTAIIWISDMPYSEVHDHEHERFLIIEGTCDLQVGENMHQLKPGDFFEVPLHVPHKFNITSDIPCKAILQRLAA